MSDPASGELIIITGPPGAGKTTVARILADRRSRSVHLPGDEFWHFIRQGRISAYRPESHPQNTVVIGVLARAAVGYAAGGYPVLLDGIIGPWFLAPFVAAAAEGGERPAVSVHYVVLNPDEATTLGRAAARGGSALTDPEPVRSLHRQFADLGPHAGHAVDSSRLTPEATADLVERGLRQGRFALLG